MFSSLGIKMLNQEQFSYQSNDRSLLCGNFKERTHLWESRQVPSYISPIFPIFSTPIRYHMANIDVIQGPALMKRVTVIGDVRLHAMFAKKDRPHNSLPSHFLRQMSPLFPFNKAGGAVMVANAIAAALSSIKPSPELDRYSEDEV
jgi:hypothetical protein